MSLYGSADYWNERYARDPEPFEWYQSWTQIRKHLTDKIDKKDRILIIGCGTSEMSMQMHADGFVRQTNIDFSSVAVKLQQERTKKTGDLAFRVMDAADMRDFESSSFDAVIDKAALDAMMCGEQSSAAVPAALRHITRVLRPGGVYICVSFGMPSLRMPFLQSPDLGWAVSTRAVPKPKIDDLREEANGKHFIYICRKATLQE
eukprot:GHVU01216113.1.p1 GENE.GHVU01216113.1~~GHVU01216113.1.p1  ORF type:complete len:204 (+),score=33.51 GHVU01216113.1:96-707(+)